MVQRPSRGRAAAVVTGFGVAAAAWVAGAPAASADEPAVWVGSPVASSTWPTGDSQPDQHHIVYTNPDNGVAYDWSADLQSVGAGSPVSVYAAPQDGSVPVRAVVQSVSPACASGNLADGGQVVQVGLYTGDTAIGSVAYAHVDATVSPGQEIDRWGGQVGTVGSYSWSSCWQGVHLHVEMASQHNYACYNRGFAPGQAVEATNFIGYTGGHVADGQRAGCP